MEAPLMGEIDHRDMGRDMASAKMGRVIPRRALALFVVCSYNEHNFER
jgi:hypothetical protein